MRKYINFIKISLVLIVFSLTGCYEQEVAPIVEPGGLGYTTATFTTDFTGTEVKEGEVITYDIELSKPLEYDLPFTIKYDGNPDDVEISELIIPAYSTTGSISISFIMDNIPEEDVPISFEVGVFNVNYQYMLHETTNAKMILTLLNKNDPDGLTVAVAWPDHGDDWDFYFIDEAGGGTEYGTDWVNWAGATGANPEIMILKDLPWWEIPDGTYYVDSDPWEVANNITNYKISVGHPDGKVEFFDAIFDMSKTDSYPTTWGYSVLKVVKAGSSYTCTLSPEFATE